MIYIGIDPGVGGGIAMVDDEGRVILSMKMPATDRDVFDSFVSHLPAKAVEALNRREVRAVLEKAQASPQMGVVSAFTYGRGYGALRMALTAARIPFDEVHPRTWRPTMGCKKGPDKNITKRRAMQIFPELTAITHATADALLLAEYRRRQGPRLT